MKKQIALLLAVIVIATMFTGCGGQAAPQASKPAAAPATTASAPAAAASTAPASGQKPELRVWLRKTYNPAADETQKKRFEDFGTSTGKCNVIVEMIPEANTAQKFNAAIEAGQLPDVAFLSTFQIRQYYDAGLLMDTSDVVNALDAKHKLFPYSISQATFDGKISAVPCYLSGVAMYYRKDYLKKAGYNEPPKTWDEVKAVAKAVTEKNPGVYGVGFTYGKCPDTENYGQCALFSLGGHVFNKDGKPALSDPESIKALKWITDLYSVDKSVPPTAVSWDASGNNKAYLSGQVAMIFNASTVGNDLQAPDYKELLANTGVAPMPSGSNGIKLSSGPMYLGVFKNTKNADLAKEAIKYHMDYDWYKGWAKSMAFGLQPIYGELNSEPAFKDPLIAPFIESNNSLVAHGYPGPYSSLAGKAWASYQLSTVFQKILVDKMTVEQAASEVDKSIAALK